MQLSNDQQQSQFQQNQLTVRAQLHERESSHEDGMYTKRTHLKSNLHENTMAGQHSRAMEMISEKSYSSMHVDF
jgi:hypothetical protein